MAEAHEAAAWTKAAHTMCVIANCNRDPARRSRPFAPADFYPLPLPRGARRSHSSTPITPANIDDLINLFVKR